MKIHQDTECREHSTGECGVYPVALPDGTGSSAAVHRHGYGAEVSVFTYCLSKNRRAGSTAAHEVAVTGWPGQLAVAGHADCGVITGELVEQADADGRHLCVSCAVGPGAYAPAPKPRDTAWDRKNAELLALGQVRGHMLYRADGKAEVALNVPAQLLVALIKDVPGRVYDPARKIWVIPAVWAGDLTASLASAGVDMRETFELPPVVDVDKLTEGLDL